MKDNIPNRKTKKALKETENHKNLESFDSVEEMFESLNKKNRIFPKEFWYTFGQILIILLIILIGILG